MPEFMCICGGGVMMIRAVLVDPGDLSFEQLRKI